MPVNAIWNCPKALLEAAHTTSKLGGGVIGEVSCKVKGGFIVVTVKASSHSIDSNSASPLSSKHSSRK